MLTHPPLGQTRRRLALATRRARHTLPGAGLRRPCLFVHMPKCGGTSLAQGLYGCVPLHRRIGVIDAPSTRRAAAIQGLDFDDPQAAHEDLSHGHHTFALREGLVLTHMAWQTPLIHGHVLLTPKVLALAGRDYGLVTMLREPQARALSNYAMAVRARVIADDLDAWLAGGIGKSMAQAYVRYLSGATVVEQPGMDAAVALACARLDEFAVVGFLDQTRAFQRRFAGAFGARPAMPRLNQAPRSGPVLSPEQRARLHDLTAPDRAIYAHALARWGAVATTPAPMDRPAFAAGTPARVPPA